MRLENKTRDESKREEKMKHEGVKKQQESRVDDAHVCHELLFLCLRLQYVCPLRCVSLTIVEIACMLPVTKVEMATGGQGSLWRERGRDGNHRPKENKSE